MNKAIKPPIVRALIYLGVLVLVVILAKDRLSVFSQSSYTQGIVVKCDYRNEFSRNSGSHTSTYTPVGLTVSGQTAKGVLYLPERSWCERLIGTSVPIFVHKTDEKQNRIGSFSQFWLYPLLVLVMVLFVTLPEKGWHKSTLISLLMALATIALMYEFNVFYTNKPETSLTTEQGKFDACVNKAMSKEGVTSRSELKVLSCAKIPDVSVLSEFHRLEEVFIRNDELDSFYEIPNLPNLKKLSVRSPKIQSFEGLEYFSSLTKLDLIDATFSSIKAMPKLEYLKSLLIRSNSNLESLAGLERFELLEGIELERNKISDISALASLKNLRVIYIMHEPVSDLSVLENLKKIEVARFRSLKTHDFSPLYNKPNMRHPGATGPNIPCEEMARWMNTLKPARRKFMWLPEHCEHLNG